MEIKKNLEVTTKEIKDLSDEIKDLSQHIENQQTKEDGENIGILDLEKNGVFMKMKTTVDELQTSLTENGCLQLKA